LKRYLKIDVMFIDLSYDYYGKVSLNKIAR
jgi:hypothetical protein